MSIIYKKNHLAFLLAIAMFLLVIFGPKFALADVSLTANGLDQSPITRGLCNVFEMANGNVGKAIAIFAIVAVGFGFFTGKFSIALVIGITLGIGILFGAPKIIAALTGGSAVDCSTITSGQSESCPGTLTASFTSLSPFQNTTTKAITYSSGSTQLMTLECKTYSSGDIRLNITPLVASGLSVRATVVSDVISGLTGAGTLVASTRIPNTGSLPLTSDSATSNIVVAPSSNAFCPTVDANIALGNLNSDACSNGAKVILYSLASVATDKSKVMCINDSSIGTINISNSNVTHKTTLFDSSNATGSKLNITGGFKNDVRKMLIATSGGISRYLVAKCTNGLWNITTTNDIIDANIATNVTSSCSGASGAIATGPEFCIAPPSGVAITLNLVP